MSSILNVKPELLQEFCGHLAKPGDETVVLFADGRTVEIPVFWIVEPPNLIAVNELAMNLPPAAVNDRYLKVLIIQQAAIAEVLCKLFTSMASRSFLKSMPTLSLIGTPSFISKKNVCIAHLWYQSGVSGIVPNVIPQPFLIFEQQAKPDGDLPVLIALVSRSKRTRIAQQISPQPPKFI
jgi:hypothetical protein